MLLTFAIILLPYFCRGEPSTQIVNPTSNEKFLLNKIETLEDKVVKLETKLNMILEKVRSITTYFLINKKKIVWFYSHQGETTKENDDKDNDIEERLENLEELAKIKILRSCEELARHGVKKSGLYIIDPDGEMISHDPIRVNCLFDGDKVVTEISHYQEKNIIVDHCDSIGCFKQDIEYDVPLEQITALISLSESCEQYIDFGCFLAPLIESEENLGGWLDRNGKLLENVLSQRD